MGACGSSQGKLAPQSLQPQQSQQSKYGHYSSADVPLSSESLNSSSKASGPGPVKVLLLGTGNGGKTSLFKQLVLQFGAGFSPEQRVLYVHNIQHNLVQALELVLNHALNDSTTTAEESSEPFESSVRLLRHLSGEFKQAKLTELNRSFLSYESSLLEQIWKHPLVQHAYKSNTLHHSMPDFARPCLARLEQIIQPQYVPSDDDIVWCRATTTGIHEEVLTLNGSHGSNSSRESKQTEWVAQSFSSLSSFQIRLVDVGGQRTERRKWMHCFSGVDVVLYVASLSDYDRGLEEDPQVNCLKESLHIFEELCQLQLLKRCQMVLCLNKSDLLCDALTRSPLSQYCPEFDVEDIAGLTNKADLSNAAIEFIDDLYQARNRDSSRVLHSYVTCATSPTSVRSLFQHLVRGIQDNDWGFEDLA